jgi:PKD repeat protein
LTSKYLLLFAFCLLPFANLKAQIVRLSTGFDNYIGSVATVPYGWYISWNSTSSPSYYFTAGNYGAAIPSYKFGITQDTIVSPHFLSGDTLKFWCRGQTPFSAQNVLGIYISEDSLTWSQIQNIDSLPVTATTFSFPIPCSAHYVMFIYFQVNGNLAFDDVKVTMTNYFPTASFAITLNNICVGDSACFVNTSTLSGCDSITSHIWNFGDSTPQDSSENSCHVFTQPGSYNVWLHITASNGNADSTNWAVIIYPLPVAQFSYNNVSGTFVDFTDQSTITSGSITSWYWSFGDSTYSSQNYPTHYFLSVGMYYVCLTVTSGGGCIDTICDSVNVVGVGIEEIDLSSGISVFPNPATNKLAIGNVQLAFTCIDIYNTFGQRVFSQQPKAKSQKQFVIDVSDLIPGIYFLKLNTGTKLYSQKIIISR